MPMNVLDWIVSEESWDRSQAGGWEEILANTGSITALTQPRSTGLAAADPREATATLEMADEWTLERIRGRLHHLLLVGSTLTTWKGIYEAWFEVIDLDPGTGAPFPQANLDMTDCKWANRSILAHYSQTHYQDSTWTDIAVHQAPYTGVFEVDVKVKRKLKSSQGIGLFEQWTSDTAAVNMPRMAVCSRLRLLGSA